MASKGGEMSLMQKRIDNVMKAMKEAKDYDMKVIWNNKLKQLFELKVRRAYERFEDQSRMVH